jgi:hypothetical protein
VGRESALGRVFWRTGRRRLRPVRSRLIKQARGMGVGPVNRLAEPARPGSATVTLRRGTDWELADRRGRIASRQCSQRNTPSSRTALHLGLSSALTALEQVVCAGLPDTPANTARRLWQPCVVASVPGRSVISAMRHVGHDRPLDAVNANHVPRAAARSPASIMAFTSCGLIGSRVTVPMPPSASSTAEAITAPAPAIPPSPAPLIPS